MTITLGIQFVTDPVLTARCGPLSFLGPRRFTPAGCTAAELRERADFVLISHNHYDHLSVEAVREIGRF